MEHIPQHQILTTGEAAALCGVSRSTLRRAVAQGQLTAWHTPGRHLRFSHDACVDFARRLGRVDLMGSADREPRTAPARSTAQESMSTAP